MVDGGIESACFGIRDRVYGGQSWGDWEKHAGRAVIDGGSVEDGLGFDTVRVDCWTASGVMAKNMGQRNRRCRFRTVSSRTKDAEWKERKACQSE